MSISLKTTNWPNLAVLLGALLALASIGYKSWKIAAPATEGQSSSVAVSQSTPTPGPTLKLNNSHSRQGAVIQAEPNNLGKTNPFQ